MFLLLNRMGILHPDTSVLHFAPEPGMFRRLSQLCSSYTPMDYNVDQYDKWSPEVRFVDLCDVDGTVTGTYDLIIHNHVLEHVPCSVSSVVAKLKARLNPGGVMLFSIPTRAGVATSEDLDPSLTHEERHARFGQWDHMRLFGADDVIEILNGSEDNGAELVPAYDYISPKEREMALLPPAIERLSGHSIYKVAAAS
ncbi:MAG: class I SAM-dependent methyltransferase [Rhodobacteraceae bacterium]|nr:class I SAM-dependent methyltransferase [Paracoccaceae bacterium]